LASTRLLGEIEAFLAERSSAFVRYRVVNPVYVRVKVEAWVTFRAGEAAGGGADRLNRELVEYLSPWFYDARRATLEGDYATEPAVADFVASRPYVEQVEEILLRHDPPLETSGLTWCFLTSAERHGIHQRPEGGPPGNLSFHTTGEKGWQS
ncbi:MAG: hypothetical protein KDD47_25945, partial [Acidobacteria bacterium]|nr:hypothetical protein [Acidobacteriota bacterium]